MTESAAGQPVRAHILVSGRVQGVGYRAFAHRAATAQGLTGGVRNLDDGRVELDVEGPQAAIEALLLQLKAGPPAGHVTKIETEWMTATGRFAGFSVWY
jgi:acylphosphatase